MNYGENILNQLLEDVKNMSIEDYIKLYDEISNRENINYVNLEDKVVFSFEVKEISFNIDIYNRKFNKFNYDDTMSVYSVDNNFDKVA